MKMQPTEIQLLTDVRSALARGDAAAARDALAGLKNHPAADFLRGCCALLDGETDEAITAFEAAERAASAPPELQANLARAWRMKADAALDADRPEEARAAYAQALERDPDDVGALSGLAAASQEICAFADAEALFGAYLTARPEDAQAHMARGACLLELRQPDAAMACFRSALALDPRRYPAVEKCATTAASGAIWLDRRAFRQALGLTS